MTDPDNLREWAVDTASGNVLALLDAYRITREALDEYGEHDAACPVWALGRGNRCDCGFQAARDAADALVRPEGDTDE